VAWNAVGMLMVVRQLRPDDAGVASGVVLLAFYAGYAAGPVAFGLSIDVTHAYTVGWIGALVCYLVTAIFAVRWYVSERSGGGYAP
jgi:predicted MFS family arabinose efflux permease